MFDFLLVLFKEVAEIPLQALFGEVAKVPLLSPADLGLMQFTTLLSSKLNLIAVHCTICCMIRNSNDKPKVSEE